MSKVILSATIHFKTNAQPDDTDPSMEWVLPPRESSLPIEEIRRNAVPILTAFLNGEQFLIVTNMSNPHGIIVNRDTVSCVSGINVTEVTK